MKSRHSVVPKIVPTPTRHPPITSQREPSRERKTPRQVRCSPRGFDSPCRFKHYCARRARERARCRCWILSGETTAASCPHSLSSRRLRHLVWQLPRGKSNQRGRFEEVVRLYLRQRQRDSRAQMVRHEPLNEERRCTGRRRHNRRCPAVIFWRPVLEGIRHSPQPGFRVVVHALSCSKARAP